MYNILRSDNTGTHTHHFSIVLLLLLSINIASAEEFLVTKTEDTADGSCDSNDCSLREAIIAANANAESDIITLGSGGFILTQGGAQGAQEEDNAAEGDLDIRSEMTITGNGKNNTIIDGNTLDRIFHILSPNTNNPTVVTIQNLTITNGAVDARNGGALNNSTLSNTSLSNVTISNSSTTNNGSIAGKGLGGGIYNNGTLTLTDATITDNTAEVNQEVSGRFGGGGLHNDINSNATLKGVTISKNKALNSSTSEAFVTGGGILNLGTLFIFDNAGTASIIGGSLKNEGNQAHSGGGVANLGGFLTIANTLIANNTTITTNNPADVFTGPTGGGLYNSNAGENRGNLIITASTIKNNYADRQGGGVFNSGAPITITHTTINNNTARFLAGGISNVGNQPAEITNSTIALNTALDDSSTASTRGGGLWTSSRINLNSVTLAGNVATQGDQLYVQDNSDDGRSIEPQVSFSNTLVSHYSPDNSPNILQASNNCAGDTNFIVSENFNLDSGNTCNFDTNNFNNQVDTNPELSPVGLAQNTGGEGNIPPTETIALEENSPAINQGSGCPALDQRYFVRDTACDTGAYESQAAASSGTLSDMKITIRVPEGNTGTAFVGSQFTYTLAITNIGPDEANNVTVTAILPSLVEIENPPARITEDNLGTCSIDGLTLTCIELGTTISGSANVFPAFETVRISVTMAPTTTGTLTTTANVSLLNAAADYFSGNNSAAISTTVNATSPSGTNFPSSGSGGGQLGFLSLLLMLPWLIIKALKIRMN